MLIGLLAAKARQLFLSTSLARQADQFDICSSTRVITLPPVSTKVEDYVSEKQYFNRYVKMISKRKIQKKYERN